MFVAWRFLLLFTVKVENNNSRKASRNVNPNKTPKKTKKTVNTKNKSSDTKKKTAKRKLKDENWDDKYIHKKTGVKYTRFNFDINGWSTIKLYLPSSKTFKYINIITGDEYNKADVDYYGKKKLTIKEIKKKERAKKYGWDERFTHKKTKVNYPKFEFDINSWSLKKVYLPSAKTDEYINIHTGDKYNKAGIDYYGNKKNTPQKKTAKTKLKNENWDDKYIHKKTGVKYTRFNFDINGWSTIKLYLPSSKTFKYINIITGDEYSKADVDYYGKKKTDIIGSEKKKQDQVARVPKDKELEGLKVELESLENVFEKLSSEKSDYIDRVDEFNAQYILQIEGPILKKQKTLLKKFKTKEKIYLESKKEYEKIKRRYRKLEKSLDEIDPFDDLFGYESSESYEKVKNELEKFKPLFVKAEKKFNVDRLNTKNIKKELEIEKKYDTDIDILYNNLQHKRRKTKKDRKATIVDPNPNDKKLIKSRITRLRKKLDLLKDDVAEINADVNYEIIRNITDLNQYFDDSRLVLKVETKKPVKKVTTIQRVKKVKKSRVVKVETKIEKSEYSQKLYAIQTPTFERVRRVSVNMVDDGKSNAFNLSMAENGKKYKALIYSALDEFMETIDDETVNIVEWESGQGIASAIAIDYIREKQLNINVSNVYLVDNDNKALSRAILHIDMLKPNELNIVATQAKYIDELKNDKHVKTIHICINSEALEAGDMLNFKSLSNCYICLSDNDSKSLNDIYKYFESKHLIANTISSISGKIGRYKRYEKIFCVNHNI